ncbi:hypothetical protein [Bradyrhizobium sp. HKCCYLS20291]|uniref:hypothetical protein n=1 Tax=Bradyrhizobium sp. HKCCYLS20291 TaxID=3420766 RepID=UPI003EBD0004
MKLQEWNWRIKAVESTACGASPQRSHYRRLWFIVHERDCMARARSSRLAGTNSSNSSFAGSLIAAVLLIRAGNFGA